MLVMDRLFKKAIVAILSFMLLAVSFWLTGGQVMSAHASEGGLSAPVQKVDQGQKTDEELTSQGKVVSNTETNPKVSESKVMTDMERKMQTIVTVDFRETPIEDVIRSLVKKADVDMVKSPQVTGNITATLTDVPLYDALDSILAVHGYGFMTTEKVVRIVPKEELALQPVKLRTKIYHLDYAKMDEAVEAVKEVLSSHGRIATNSDTKHIVITDSETSMELIDQFIAEMDKEIPQILVEARVYDVSSSTSLDLGVNWSAGRLTFFDPETGQALTGGESHTEPFTYGMFNSGVSRAPNTDALLRFGILNDHIDIDAVIEASQDDINARLLANPKILVLNGEVASIKVVSEIPYQELTQTSGGGNIGTTSFKEVGIQLEVTPHITRENKIRMQIRPTFSVQVGSVPMPIVSGVQTITSTQPIVDKREASTHALVTSNQTVVIGGLKKKDVVQEISKVPILSGVPILGALFKFKGEKTVNSELIVFITPRIIREPVLSERETMQFESAKSEMCDPKEPMVTIDPCQE